MGILLARGPTVSTALTALATLPGSGAYEAAPAVGAMISIPQTYDKATITITYTVGTSGGQAAFRVYSSDGTRVAQTLAPDLTYGPAVTGPVGTSTFSFGVNLEGFSKVGLTGAEVGVTGTPGSYTSWITFG